MLIFRTLQPWGVIWINELIIQQVHSIRCIRRSACTVHLILHNCENCYKFFEGLLYSFYATRLPFFITSDSAAIQVTKQPYLFSVHFQAPCEEQSRPEVEKIEPGSEKASCAFCNKTAICCICNFLTGFDLHILCLWYITMVITSTLCPYVY